MQQLKKKIHIKHHISFYGLMIDMIRDIEAWLETITINVHPEGFLDELAHELLSKRERERSCREARNLLTH